MSIMSSHDNDIEGLRNWYQGLRPVTVDLVGDFAGKELFVIHGESLLSHCITDAQVDYQEGFQLLHAVHAVESFLQKLQERSCNFHIVWFSNHEDLCIPAQAANGTSYKYHLTRTILIQHLDQRPDSTPDSKYCYQFPGISSDEFKQYLNQNAVHFFLCSDGRSSRASESVSLTSFMYELSHEGYSIGILDDLVFHSSKVYAPIFTASTSPRAVQIPQPSPLSAVRVHSVSKITDGFKPSSTSISGRDYVTTLALSVILKMEHRWDIVARVAAFLLHLTALRHCSLADRRCHLGPSLEADEEDLDNEFLGLFATASMALIQNWSDPCFSDLRWDLFDLVDGRIFQAAKDAVNAGIRLPPEVHIDVMVLARQIEELTGVEICDEIMDMDIDQDVEATNRHDSVPPGEAAVLPFRLEPVNKLLTDVQLRTADDLDDTEPSIVFQELTHWHNSKLFLDPKRIRKRPGYFARKRNQKFMADTIKYSASLTNASGKIIDPEIIVTGGHHAVLDKKSKPKTYQQSLTPKKPRPKTTPIKGGKEQALEAARSLQVQKLRSKTTAARSNWKLQCKTLEAEPDNVKCYMMATKYLSGLSSSDEEGIRPESSLYICRILGKILERSTKESTRDGYGVLAMIHSRVLAVSKLPNLSAEVLGQVMSYSRAFKLPDLFLQENLGIDSPSPGARSESRADKIVRPWMKNTRPLQFQLQHCGPYLERSFDSAPDPRVSFEPDEWQRQVLDAIDEDKSIFVVAPTSAGKTFISFYAMKKILQASDDDVLVYVAPTKALVNQIAAEIQARFSKSYHHEGRSVWAIHTRDYRVNSPDGCQILVTVPHILQIMLLAPVNSQKEKSWARRVKRIIFDEVHCIGQAEDGIIWEQLILLAPCPIIALSATVGNPAEFKAWLDGSQTKRGNKLEMIIHSSRYSDLRKYLYIPPQEFTFKGIERKTRLPIPGLEDQHLEASSFQYIHPVAALVNRNRDTLDDITFEPRDCLDLWEAMDKRQTRDFPLHEYLEPKNFLPEVLRKIHILSWEAALKITLQSWMRDPRSPFPDVLAEFREGIDNQAHLEKGASRSANLPLLLGLQSHGALPAIMFNYDRAECEKALQELLDQLVSAEDQWKKESLAWFRKVAAYEKWLATKDKIQAVATRTRAAVLANSELSKSDLARDDASQEASKWEGFDPDAPLDNFSFADHTKLSKEELHEAIVAMKDLNLQQTFLDGLRRGICVHHAGMNRQYRQVVEMLFRKGFLTVVIATGTLALGINMPCKTVVFTGDSVYLTALNYRQAAGRAGRRGFDFLGNVVFHGIPTQRVFEIMSSKLPDLRGQFPLSTTLVLRLLALLHQTDNSEYAQTAFESLLSQTRLFLGGPASQMAIKHHVRFSIEYLRRQHLLSADGEPLNFAGLVGHLYFTENAVFALHALLKGGYFHRVCAKIKTKPRAVLYKLVLVLAHIFGRISCPRYKDEKWLKEVVYPSSSIVILPDLPKEAKEILQQHNQETLDIFQAYVHTYVRQHLANKPDCVLPFTKHEVKPAQPWNNTGITGFIAPTEMRSPFAALSGFDDTFSSIHDLCASVRQGVFLEESAVPHIPISPDDTTGVPLNAYLLDFFQHGDLKGLVAANGIKKGDVWFKLKDFSLVLATMVTSLEGIVDPAVGEEELGMADVQDAGDVLTDGMEIEREETPRLKAVLRAEREEERSARKTKAKKKVVPDSWEDDNEVDEDLDSEVEGQERETEETGTQTPPGWVEGGNENLQNVLLAFSMLREEFDDKFKKVWA